MDRWLLFHSRRPCYLYLCLTVYFHGSIPFFWSISTYVLVCLWRMLPNLCWQDQQIYRGFPVLVRWLDGSCGVSMRSDNCGSVRQSWARAKWNCHWKDPGNSSVRRKIRQMTWLTVVGNLELNTVASWLTREFCWLDNRPSFHYILTCERSPRQEMRMDSRPPHTQMQSSATGTFSVLTQSNVPANSVGGIYEPLSTK